MSALAYMTHYKIMLDVDTYTCLCSYTKSVPMAVIWKRCRVSFHLV